MNDYTNSELALTNKKNVNYMDSFNEITLTKIFQSVERYEDKMTEDVRIAVGYAEQRLHDGESPYIVLSDLLAQVFFSAEYCVEHPTAQNCERLRLLEKFGKVITNAYFAEAEDLVKEIRGEEFLKEVKQSNKKNYAKAPEKESRMKKELRRKSMNSEIPYACFAKDPREELDLCDYLTESKDTIYVRDSQDGHLIIKLPAFTDYETGERKALFTGISGTFAVDL